MGKFKYIFLFLVLFIFSIPGLKAQEDYVFACDYDLKNPMFGDSTFSLKVYVYSTSSAKFFYNGKELKNNSNNFLNDYDFYDWSIAIMRFQAKDFAKKAMTGSYSCPKIMVQSMSDSGYVNVNMTFGDQSVTDSSTQVLNSAKSQPGSSSNNSSNSGNSQINTGASEINSGDSYNYYCDYQLINPMFRDSNNPSQSPKFSMRAYVYNSETAKFFYNGKELKNNSNIFMDADLGFYDWGTAILRFQTKDYAKAATTGGYNCPKITVQSMSDSGYVSVHLFYGDQSVVDNGTQFVNESVNKPNVNESLSSDAQNQLNNNTITITKECTPVNYPKDNLKQLNSNVSFVFYMKSNGEKWVRVKYDGNSADEKFSASSITEVRLGRGTGFYDIFYFYPEDYSTIFKQTRNQANNNTFTCPTGLPSISPTKVASMPGYANEFVVTYSKKVLEENGDIKNAYELTDTPLAELGDGYKLNMVVSSTRGFCTDYLGRLDNEEYEIADLLNSVYFIIKVGSVILVIVMSMYEFAASTTKSKDELMDIVKKLSTRLIILVIILLLPTVIDMLGNLFGVDDILCGIK